MPDFEPRGIEIGMTGELGGQRYEVAGRILMSMEDGGETYHWTEYYLVAPDGASATLVQESGQRGMEWRIFREFEPSNPITAAQAASKRVGDRINLTGDSLRVSCVDESRVNQIEGRAPEGMEEGDIAHYFNAESGNQMVVVSWTGDEVEVFRGIQLPGHAVQRAFGLKGPPSVVRPPPLRQPLADSAIHSELSAHEAEQESSGRRGAVIALIVIIVLTVVIAWRFKGDSIKTYTRRTVPKPGLKLGQTAAIGDIPYRVAGHSVLQVARVGQKEVCHEYTLVDDTGATAMLVQEGDQWQWFRTNAVAAPLSPQEAGGKKLGDKLALGGLTLQVDELFLTTVNSAEGTVPFGAGTVRYGLGARESGRRIVACWLDAVTVYDVTLAKPAEIAAFQSK